ncbi:hypothetical protein HAX54_049465 [Datura stramonium]|uniref:Uncharacterized protein n=1 Tax=Datura stramonium TaxID=4076 RepID=A0ABS8SWM6_DATST|nr:hypothetical protein [Datura stramonium]
MIRISLTERIKDLVCPQNSPRSSRSDNSNTWLPSSKRTSSSSGLASGMLICCICPIKSNNTLTINRGVVVDPWRREYWHCTPLAIDLRHGSLKLATYFPFPCLARSDDLVRSRLTASKMVNRVDINDTKVVVRVAERELLVFECRVETGPLDLEVSIGSLFATPLRLEPTPPTGHESNTKKNGGDTDEEATDVKDPRHHIGRQIQVVIGRNCHWKSHDFPLYIKPKPRISAPSVPRGVLHSSFLCIRTLHVLSWGGGTLNAIIFLFM